MSKHLRSLLTQLRSDTLPLEIETGRYYGITREQRICKQCYLNVIENEQHFLFDCPKYITYRTALHYRLQEANLDDTSCTVKMEFLFSSCKTIITLAKYIEISLKHHVWIKIVKNKSDW